MKLLQIIVIIFLIYFIRRLIQMYRVMKQIQAEQEALRKEKQDLNKGPKKDENVINADFKIMD